MSLPTEEVIILSWPCWLVEWTLKNQSLVQVTKVLSTNSGEEEENISISERQIICVSKRELLRLVYAGENIRKVGLENKYLTQTHQNLKP